jgi:16S rRNA (cytosine967-C5)-methyltransferase
LPNPAEKPADYLSTVFSLPKWLVTDWLEEFGVEQTRQICLASNRRPSIYLRPNRLKTTAQELVEKLHKAGINAEIVPEVEIIRLKNPRAIIELPDFAEGLFTVQDIAASRAVRLLQPKAGWTILDLCAAPGGKTTQLAEVTGDSAKIVATDIDSNRLKRVEENISRLCIKSVAIITYDSLTLQKQGFDVVLLDVPCSNTGVLAKRVETRYRLEPKVIEELAGKQSELLKKAAEMIKPAGVICYSTCSIQKVENSQLVRNFLHKNPKFAIENEQLILPSTEGFDHDGGYIAIIIKKPSRVAFSHEDTKSRRNRL